MFAEMIVLHISMSYEAPTLYGDMTRTVFVTVSARLSSLVVFLFFPFVSTFFAW
jgi:hypothetical protein